MQYPAILTSDLHLVAAPSCNYRWDLFPWLVEEARHEKVKTICILGDITDAKDNHSAELVNKVVGAIKSLAQVARVIILAGNHDWLRQGHEFFKFLNALDNVVFVTSPWEDDDVKGEPTLWLPHSKDPAKDWSGFDFSHYTYVFMHQTIKGAIASNGQAMEGEDLPDLGKAGKIYSGDIHVPQIIGPLEYVGSPYAVHFGDKFKGRVVLLERRGAAPVNLYFKSIGRLSIKAAGLDNLRRQAIQPGDQVKAVIELTEAEKHDWSRVKREAGEYLRERGAIVASIELKVIKSERRMLAGEASPGRSMLEDIERFVRAEELGGDAYEAAARIAAP